MSSSNGVMFFLVLLVIGVLTYLVGFGAPVLGIPSINDMRYGIDIKGGISTTLYPDLPAGQAPTADELKAARQVIERRLDSKGIYDRNITTEPENGRIIVEIPYKPGETDLNPQKSIDELAKRHFSPSRRWTKARSTKRAITSPQAKSSSKESM